MGKGKAFAAHLARKGLSQSEAARRLGVPHPTVWRWVKGRTAPSPLAKALLKTRLGFAWPE